MKKIAILTALLLCVSSTAFAAATISMGSPLTSANTGKSVWAAKSGETAVSGTNLIAKTSSGVGVGIFTDGGGLGYTVVTQHLKGGKAYGTSYDSTSIFSTNVTTKATPELAVPTAITTTDFSSWTSL